jgi:hypothetical protein
MPSTQSIQTAATIRFLRKMKTRNDAGIPFLEDDQLSELNEVLKELTANGLTDANIGRTQGLLAFLQEHDDHWTFLDPDHRDSDHRERNELARLLESPGPEEPAPLGIVPLPATTNSGQPALRANRMTAGEGISWFGIIAGGVAATVYAYMDPSTIDSFFWVGFWAFIFGSSLAGDIRRRSIKKGVSVSAVEGTLVGLVWALASVGIIVIGRGYENGNHVSLTAFLAYLVASTIGESITGLDRSDDTKNEIEKGVDDGIDDSLDDAYDD